jgi:hypothetical protein
MTSYATDAEISVKGRQLFDTILYAASGTGPIYSARTPADNSADVKGLTLQRNAFDDGGNNVVITIQRTGATDATVFSAMRWEEIR